MSMSSAAANAAVEAIDTEFRLWLAWERGLSAAAVCCYGKQARKFLSWLPDPVDSAVRQLDSTQVTSFSGCPGSTQIAPVVGAPTGRRGAWPCIPQPGLNVASSCVRRCSPGGLR